jgi:hypothetical protein
VTARPVIEISPIPDIVCCELAMVERIGPLTRLTFAMPQSSAAPAYGDTRVERVVVAKLVVPSEALSAIIQRMGQVAHSHMTTGGQILDDDTLSTRH